MSIYRLILSKVKPRMMKPRMFYYELACLYPGEFLHHSRHLLATHRSMVILVTVFATPQKGSYMNSIDEPCLTISSAFTLAL